MTIWTPNLSNRGPRYRAIADAIADAVAAGQLAAGDRLPPQRDLADAIGVTVGTVSRGYAEAERRGLIAGEVGRGTFVRGARATDPWPQPGDDAGAVDLSLSLPAHLANEGALLAETLRQIAADREVSGLLRYQPQSANRRQLDIATSWLGRVDLNVSAEQVLFTAGSQHGLNVAFAALFRKDAVVLTSELTYPSVKQIARSLGIRLRPVAMDDEGMCPDAMARACRIEPRPAGVYLVPTLQNPTTATQSAARRRAIADVATAHELWIVEDDIHALLPPQPIAPLATYAPDRTVYLSSVAKCLVPGLRTGFIAAPAALRARLLGGIHATMWMPPPLMVEVTCRWISDGTADQLLVDKRRETNRRQQLAQRVLGHHDIRADPNGYQLWLQLPEPWHADEVVAAARERDIIIIGAGAFAIGRQAPRAVRVCIGAPSITSLQTALATLDDILTDGAAPSY